MGQWQSQTRKMNRHYQSVSKGDEGLIYLDWPFISQTVYLYPASGSGGSSYLELFTPSNATRKRFSVIMEYNYFLDPVNSTDYQWTEKMSFTFYFSQSKVKSVTRVVKTIDGVEYPATQVVIPLAWVPDISDELFNATTQEPDITPFSDAIENIVITYTDVYQAPSPWDEGYFENKRKLIIEYQGTIKDFAYVGEYLNREAIETIDA
jgi:hypothetical protein